MSRMESALLAPRVLALHLLLLLGREVVLNVKELTDLLHSLAFDQGGDLGARKLKQRLDVKVVGSHDDLEKHLLVDIDVISVPLLDNLGEVSGAERLLNLWRRVLDHALHEDEHLLHNWLVHLGNGDVIVCATVLDQAVDQL